MIGVLKSFLGLSGSFFTTIYVSFLEPDSVSFLLLLAIIPSAIVLACTLVINFVPYIQVEPHTKVCAGGDVPVPRSLIDALGNHMLLKFLSLLPLLPLFDNSGLATQCVTRVTFMLLVL